MTMQNLILVRAAASAGYTYCRQFLDRLGNRKAGLPVHVHLGGEL
jgi:hypothetical protein